jgi:hypothetical protein
MAEEPRKTTLWGYLEQMYQDWGEHRKDKEIEWQEDLDNFLAAEETSKWKSKDAVKKKKEDEWKSSVFVRVVKEKVVMAYTFLNDLVLQGGEIPFMLKPNEESYSVEEMELAQDHAKNMRKKIKDQLVEAKADRTFMKGTFSMALYGETWAKSPLFREVEKKRWRRSFAEGFEGDPDYQRFEQEVMVEIKPAIDYKSVWNMFMDPEYEDPQEGRGIIERDYISAYDLRQKKGKPGYNDDAIDKVIAENINRSNRGDDDTSSVAPFLRDINNPDRTIQYLEFWGRVPRKYLEDYQPDVKSEIETSASDVFNLSLVPEMGDDIEITMISCNETIVRILPNDSGKRPYRKVRFENMLDDIHGIGTARNVVDAQQIINGAYRNVIDNIALSGNVIIGLDSDSLAAGQSQNKKLYPGKQIRFKQGTDIRQAMGSITIQNVAGQLIELLGIAKQHSDEESMIPRIMQGDVAEKKKPDTLGEINLLFQNAGKYMGQVVKNIDEDYLEPIIEDIYDYNMMNPEFQQLQGDFTVHALGFNSFQSKVIKMQSLRQFLEILFVHDLLIQEAKFRPILEEMGKALDLDPEQYLYSDEEKAQMQELQAAAQEEEFQRQLQLAQAQLETEAEVEVEKEDQIGDNELQRDLIKQDQKSENKIDEIQAKAEAEDLQATNETEREIIKEKAISKITNLAEGRKAKAKAKPKPKAKGASNGTRKEKKEKKRGAV